MILYKIRQNTRNTGQEDPNQRGGEDRWDQREEEAADVRRTVVSCVLCLVYYVLCLVSCVPVVFYFNYLIIIFSSRDVDTYCRKGKRGHDGTTDIHTIYTQYI